MIRNRTRFADYDKFYQNVFPGAVESTGSMIGLSAYDHAIARQNLFSSTDVTYGLNTGAVRHALLFGAEVGRQTTQQLRRTGYFEGGATSLDVPFLVSPVSVCVIVTSAPGTAPPVPSRTSTRTEP